MYVAKFGVWRELQVEQPHREASVANKQDGAKEEQEEEEENAC